MNIFENTLFINLDERQDRLQHVINEFNKIGIINSIRIPAIRHPSGGALGCTLSHIQCLEYAIANNFEHVFIAEDDISFTNVPVLLNSIQHFLSSNVEWDVLIIGGNLAPPFIKNNEFFVRVFNCQTTTGYVVKKHYFNTLLDNFKFSAHNLIPIDIGWKLLQKIHAWFFIIPMTVTQYPNFSDIEHKFVNYLPLMLRKFR
jgi:GR25 family glycosyltransferase involved in LPS biosynthesis